MTHDMPQFVALIPPTSPTPLVFEDMFFGEYTKLIVLTQQRRAALRAQASTADIKKYVDAWRTFIAQYVYDAGSSARSLLPLSFTWQTQLFSNAPVHVTTSATPLFETVCSSMMLVAALIHDNDIAAAHDQVRYLEEQVLPLFVLRTTTREPDICSHVLMKAIDCALTGQRVFTDAIEHMQHDGAAAKMSSLMLKSAAAFHEATSRLPLVASFTQAHATALALAHRYAATALVESPVEAHRGVAVAMARRAAAIAPSNSAVLKYAESVVEQNTLEFGMQTVPTQVVLELRQAQTEPMCVIETTEGTWCITMAE